MKLIPKINLSDSKTWVEPTQSVCISIMDLKRGFRYLEREYFENKKIIISGILPDEYNVKYLDLLEDLQSKHLNQYHLTTADCATYDSMSQQERIKQIQTMLGQNYKLFKRYPGKKFIGILAGTTSKEYEWTYAQLKPHCESYLLYLTGYIRSNPRYFNLLELLERILPRGFKEPLYCYGFNNASIQYLSEIQKKWNLAFAISESYRTEAVFSGGTHYRRETKMKIAWKKKLKFFEN